MEGHIIGKPSFDQKSKLERRSCVHKFLQGFEKYWKKSIQKCSPFQCFAEQNSNPNFENPDKCWHSKEFRFIYDPLHYLRTKKCHFGSGFTRLIYYPLKSNENFYWNIHRFMWKTLHFRPIHVTHNSYEKEFSIVPFYIHHLPFYHYALIFNIFHHVFMSFFIPTRACVPSQFTTGLQVYPLQIKLYNWPQYCNIFF